MRGVHNVIALGQAIEDLDDRTLGLPTARQDGRHAAQQVRAAAERLQDESHFAQQRQFLRRDRHLIGRQVEDQRLQQRLGRNAATRVIRKHLLVEHPLVRRMLVDEVHAVRPLRDDVRGRQLADYAQHGEQRRALGRRVVARGCGRGRVGRTGRVQCEARLHLGPAMPRAKQRVPARVPAAAHLDRGRLLRPCLGHGRDRAASRGNRRLVHQRAAHRALHRGKHRVGLPEPHLGLRRVDVDVEILGIHLEEHHRDRVAPHGEQRVIRLDDRVRDGAVLEPAAVDEQADVSPVGAVQGGCAHIAAHRGAAPVMQGRSRSVVRIAISAQGDHLAGELQAVDLDQHVEQLARSGRLEEQLAVGYQGEAALGIRQRVAGHDLLDVRGLGRRLLEELQPRGHVGKQVLHGHCGAPRRAHKRVLHLVAFGHPDECGRVAPLTSREQCHLRHRGDACEGLPAEPKGGQVPQILRGAELGGRVAQESHAHLVRRDAAAVILDPDQAPPSLPHLHPDIGRAGIQAVLDQFLDSGRGPLDHLAGGDLIGDFGCQDTDRHGRHSNTGAWKQRGGGEVRAEMGRLPSPAKPILPWPTRTG